MSEVRGNVKADDSSTGIVVVVIGFFAIVFMVGVLAAIAIPNFVAMQLKAKRAEVPGNVDGLKTAELSYHAAFDAYLPVGSPGGDVGKEMRDWEGGPDWDKLGWRPDGKVRGWYWVEVEGDHFTVHGICDVDGDGERAEYVADENTNATMVSDRDTH